MASSIEEIISGYREEGIQRIKLAITDIDGVLRGKYVSLDKFESLVRTQGGFCDCVFGWDLADILYDNSKYTGWHTAYPDALFKLDISSERRIPDENVPFFIADFVDKDGHSPHPICPRNVFKKVLHRAEQMGFKTNLAFEYEFFVFNETPQSVREKEYKNMEPFTPGMFGYSIIRNSAESEIFNDFMDYFLALNIEIEGLHCETGPGVWEAAIKYGAGLEATDSASIFKTFSKVFFQKCKLMATFMARWNLEYPGQSGHIHQSLTNLNGDSVFYDSNDSNGMSLTMKHYVAGQIKYLKSFLAMTSPTINSYTRLVKGFWAPTASTWGVENRTCALRVIPGNEKSQRVEFRVGSADANPYLAAAAILAAGLQGIEEKLELCDPVKGNAYEVQGHLDQSLQFPSNLSQSTNNFEASSMAGQIFGEEFKEHFIASRRWEVREYEKAITDWQLERYFEII